MSELGGRLRELVDANAPPIDVGRIAEDVPDRRQVGARGVPISAVLAVTAVVVVLVAAAVIGWGHEPGLLIDPVGPAPEPTASGPAAPAAPAPAALEVGPDTSWTWERLDLPDGARVLLDGGDRVLAPAGYSLFRSFDGLDWVDLRADLPADVRRHLSGTLDLQAAAWEDTVVALSSTATQVRIVHPDGRVDYRGFDRLVHAVGIGPGGVVAVTAGDAAEGEAAGWHLPPDGDWRPFEGPLGPVNRLVGTPTGFYGVVDPLLGPGGVWSSPDGQRWRHDPLPPGVTLEGQVHRAELSRWDDGALLAVRSLDERSTTLLELGPAGIRVVDMIEQGGLDRESRAIMAGAGQLGIVAVDLDGQVHHAATAAPLRRLQPPAGFGPPDPDRWPPDRHVILTGQAIFLSVTDAADPTEVRWWRIAPDERAATGDGRETEEESRRGESNP
jgi:hypothetical protein